MTKRDKVKRKFDGLCAYTGKPLGQDWQIDHMIPKCNIIQRHHALKSHNDFENLLPTCRIINHYKRGFDVEGFRQYMMNFHNRLSKLPKKTKCTSVIRRKTYMLKVAELFDIDQNKPFNGIFYFETLIPSLTK